MDEVVHILFNEQTVSAIRKGTETHQHYAR